MALEPAGDRPIYASYFGGEQDDQATALAVDPAGRLVVTGQTASRKSLPLKNAFQTAGGGAGDAFVASFDARGQLEYATYFGGEKKDAGASIALDAFGAATVTGSTGSQRNLPLQKALPNITGGATDAFLARFDRDGRLVFSSRFGGRRDDSGAAVALDQAGDAWLSGATRSQNDLPLMNPLQAVSGGNDDAFLAKIHINSAPRIRSEAPTEAIEGIAYRYAVEAEDEDGNVLGYILLDAPLGMVVDSGGRVEWLAPAAGTHAVTIRVSDDSGAYAEQSFQLTVGSQNRPPEILSQPPAATVVDRNYRYAVEAQDPDADPLRFELLKAPLGMRIDPAAGRIEWRPVAAGNHPVEIRVDDGRGLFAVQHYVLVVDYDPADLPPVFAAPGDQTIAPGSTLVLDLIASDPENQPLTFSVHPLPLPAGATLDVRSGRFTFRPAPAQAGDHVLTFSVDDGRHRVEQTITIAVSPIDPSAPTRLFGRVVDSTALARGIDLPIVGATVSFLETEVATVTDANGNFMLDDLPDGVFVFSIDSATAHPAPGGAPYASYRVEKPLVLHADNVETRPFSLPRIDPGSLTTINPVLPSIVQNATSGVSMAVPANTAFNDDGSQFTGPLSISEVPRGLTPGTLPEGLDPALVVTIQPVGVRFATPVPITFPNTEQLPPGAEVEIYSLDPDTGLFAVVGLARVSADSQRIETFSGGIRQADWHFFNSKPDDPQPKRDPDHPCNCPKAPGGSTFTLSDGRMNTAFSLPAYRSLEQSRALTFTWHSDRALPNPQIPVNTGLGPFIAAPATLSVKLAVAGLAQDFETHYAGSSLQRPIARPNA
ncbi:MAG: putative Ig domain-containing protein, partial [Methylococcales bacterium]